MMDLMSSSAEMEGGVAEGIHGPMLARLATILR